MQTSRIENYLELGLQAAAAGSKVLLAHLSKQNEALVIRAKRDGSLVSAVDLESHRVIQHVLSASQIPIISEEGELPPYAERAQWPWFWLVDPLDGTESYLNHREGFAVNIALCDHTGPVLGIIADPLSEVIYAGSTGSNPFIAEMNQLDQRKPIRSNPPQPPYRLVTSWNEPLSSEYLIPESLNPDLFTVEAVSGALKFCQVLTGEADVHARSASYMEWDCAAGDGILRSIGLPLRDRDTHEPLSYNTMSLRTGNLYASRI